MTRSSQRVFLVSVAGALAIGVTGCVETSVYEKAARDLEAVQRTSAQKDLQVRSLQWQLAQLGQQVYEAQQRNEAYQAQLRAEIQKLAAQNAELAERLTKEEQARAALLATAAADTAAPPGRAGGRADDVRRLIAALDARNAQIVEQLGRIERQLAASAAVRAPPEGRVERRAPGSDIRDPWDFGSRK